MITDENFLNEVASRKKHTFISTGMSNFDMIDKAVKIFKKNECSFELMHCISAYPFDSEIANLNMIKILRDRYKCNVGYSGHEKGGKLISLAAISLGSTSLERHLTLDRTMYGSDQAASLEERGLTELMNITKKVPILIGNEEKQIFEVWAKNRPKQSLLVVVPRHPERFDWVFAQARNIGFKVMRRSEFLNKKLTNLHLFFCSKHSETLAEVKIFHLSFNTFFAFCHCQVWRSPKHWFSNA